MTSENALIHAAAVEAAQNGPRKPHALEYFGVIGFFVLIAILAGRVYEVALVSGAWLVLGAAAVGFVVSDLVSGLVHWLFDTWGSPETPVLGKNFIIPFRVHHLDPKDITRHGFIATNGHNCLVSLPPLAACLFIPLSTVWGPPLVTLIVMMCLGVFGTNQFHKWAHMAQPPAFVGTLQKFGLILGPDHHDVHHASPYAAHYCITTGWLNKPLDRMKFFRGLEKVITAVTGVQPRRDDLKHEAK